MAETKIIISAATAQAENSMRTLGQSVDGVSRKLFDLSGVAATLGGALSITAFAGFIKSSIDAADQLNDLAQKTGTSVEMLAGLKLAADQNGTSLEAVAQASKKLATNMAEQPDTFRKFGITAKDSTGALIQLADIFAGMPDGVEKTALAVKLMGKSGEEMIPFLNQGSDALRRLADEGARLNPITAEMAKQADQFNDDLAALKMQAGGLGIQLANTMLPALNDTAAAMKKLSDEGHPVLALWRGLAGMGKISWDFLYPPENLSKSLSSVNRIKELKSDLAGIEDNLARTGGRGGMVGKWLHGTREEQLAQANMLKNQIAALEKFGAQLDKKPESQKTDKPKEPNQDVSRAACELGGGKWVNGKCERGGDGKKTDPFKLENEAWVREKEFQIAQIEELNKKKQKSDRELQRSALEAQAIIFDIDPIARASAEWEKLIALKKQGLLTDEQVAKSYAKTFGEIDKSGNDAFKSLENAVRGWGNQFTDEMTKMVRTGKADFAGLADSVINDLIRIQVQKRITDPLMKAGTSFLDSFNIGKMFGFAEGGIMSSAGPLPLHKYASGGIASKPQFALFGEGRMNEAFVPLPDGRSIPVSMRGGGAPTVVVNQTVNIDSRSDASVIMAAMGRAKDMAKAEILNSLSRGGDFARATGRA